MLPTETSEAEGSTQNTRLEFRARGRLAGAGACSCAVAASTRTRCAAPIASSAAHFPFCPYRPPRLTSMDMSLG